METKHLTALLESQMRSVYGYCLRRCGDAQDAQDVAQEILLRAHAALLKRKSVPDPLRYLWTIARNTLANHYRDRSRCTVGLPPELTDDTGILAAMEAREEVRRLHDEVARLGRQQREIVTLHYFHGMTQPAIAAALQLPVGTVKWHLFEARKELKQYMTAPHTIHRLKFDPIRFSAFHNEGSIGDEGSPWRIFRSALNQNIAYACWREARTPTQIADALGVAPVYIEDAVSALAAQGYLSESGGKYRCAFLLTEWDAELIRLWDKAHQQAAALIAPALEEALSPTMLADERIGVPAGFSHAYALWALIPWMISTTPDGPVTFADVATFRPDGAHDVIKAEITPPGVPQPALAALTERFNGPCWNERDGQTLWQMDTIWSPQRIGEIYAVTEQRVISLLQKQFLRMEPLSEEECGVLMQRGVLRRWHGPSGDCRITLQALWLKGQDIRKMLQQTARDVYRQHRQALDALCQPLADALMEQTPAPMHTLRRYTLQGLFHSPRFILHCLNHLVESGRLPLPSDEEKASLHTIFLTN